jgi:anti-sigma-K factor RskA
MNKNNRKCKKIKRDIQAYLDNQLSLAKKKEFEQHIKHCQSCREEYIPWQNLFRDLELVGQQEKEAPNGLNEKIMERIEEKSTVLRPTFSQQIRRFLSLYPISLRWVGAVAMVLLVVGITVNSLWLSPAQCPAEQFSEVNFSLAAESNQLSSVAVVGDFNNWDPSQDLLKDEDSDGIWTATLELESGRYEYMFILDGERWIPDPQAYHYVRDGFGGKNSVIEISGGCT